MTTCAARCVREMKSRIAMTKAAFNRKKILFTSELKLRIRKKVVKCCMWSTAWTLRKVE
jgi:hypothetical protein